MITLTELHKNFDGTPVLRGASHVVRRWNRMSITVRAARRRAVSPSQ